MDRQTVKPYYQDSDVTLYHGKCEDVLPHLPDESIGGEFKELDHYAPISAGGVHTLENVRPSCTKCNAEKRATDGALWECANDHVLAQFRDLAPDLYTRLYREAAQEWEQAHPYPMETK